MNDRERPSALLGSIAVIAAAGVVFPTASVGAWSDEEWVHPASVGTSQIECGADTGYAAESNARFLRGDLLGVDLDPLVELKGVGLAMDNGGSVTVDPGSAANLGATPPAHSYANPLSLGVISLPILDLSPLQIGLPVGSLGAVNQYARVNGHGSGAAAAGLVNNSGAVLVSAITPDDQLPEPAVLTLDSLLPGISGIAGTDVRIGAVGSSSQLDWCDALRSDIWGDGSVSGVSRDYGVASLELDIDSPLVAGLGSSITSTVLPGLQTDLNALTGVNGLISKIFTDALAPIVAGLNLGATTGDVTLTGLDFTAVSALLDDNLVGDGVSVDLVSGLVHVDLEYFIGALNDQPANTELVLDAGVVSSILANTTALLNNWRAAVFTTIQDAVYAATLTIDLSVVVSSPAIVVALVPIGATNIVRVDLDATATIGSIIGGGLVLDVNVTALSNVTLIGTILNAILGITLTTLTNSILALETSLVAPIAAQVTATVNGALDSVDTQLVDLVAAVLGAVSAVLTELPSILSVMVNVQPDQPGAPPGTSFIAESGLSSAQHAVSALRLGLAYGLAPGGVAAFDLATSSVGPITAP
ncbi:hypothetical protein FHX48_000731 [Microbacterium halimionae]|uniref:Choice-of-anchor G family protein n=1 Tax=Microbacterium halimionae TaxID=1526413 RepID=A0A7W3JMM6_9MICO|nr:choice-of-anchor G family protein [Microbacterium halimionae]MBA8815679.1 hypothetical protein [Microbacterium halimionae]NII95725.1 hypothetical protein [Microbacterium halimionae]